MAKRLLRGISWVTATMILFIGGLAFGANFFATTAPNLPQLDANLKRISDAFLLQYPKAQFLIAGGSGRAFVDAALQGKELKFRDIDVQIVLNEPVVPEKINSIYLELTKDDALKPLDDFTGSYKEFFMTDGERSVDVSFYSSIKQILPIGVFDIDAIKMAYTPGETLENHLKEMTTEGYANSVKKERILDIYSAYNDYLQGKLKPNPDKSYWPEYPSACIRTVRTMGKMNLDKVPDNIKQWLQEVSKSEYEFSRYSWVKLMYKLLSDKNAATELKLLSEMKIMGRWSTYAEAALKKMSVTEIERALDLKNTSQDPFLVYQKLAELTPPREQYFLAKNTTRLEKTRGTVWMNSIREKAGIELCKKVF